MMESNGGLADQQIVKRPKGPVLRIQKVRKEDAGTYICTASNNVGTMSADQIELRVLCKITPTFRLQVRVFFCITNRDGTI